VNGPPASTGSLGKLVWAGRAKSNFRRKIAGKQHSDDKNNNTGPRVSLRPRRQARVGKLSIGNEICVSEQASPSSRSKNDILNCLFFDRGHCPSLAFLKTKKALWLMEVQTLEASLQPEHCP
jgi:hypothetical protein